MPDHPWSWKRSVVFVLACATGPIVITVIFYQRWPDPSLARWVAFMVGLTSILLIERVARAVAAAYQAADEPPDGPPRPGA